MTLSISDNWKERAGRDSNALRFILEITKGVTTWAALDGLCDSFSYPVALNSHSPFSQKMDVLERRIAIGENTVVVDRDWIRDVIVANRLRGSKMRLKIGFKDLAESDFVNFWTGVIEGVFPEPTPETETGEVRLEGKSAFEVLRQAKVTGQWVQVHPLEAIYKGDGTGVLERAGLDSSLIDTAAFDPDAYNTISHIVVTRASLGTVYTDGTVREPTSALDLADELAMLLNGMLYTKEDGTISFRVFDPSAAAVAAWDRSTFDEDDVRQVSLDDDLINRVDFKFLPEGQAAQFAGGGASTFNGVYQANDTDSQAAHAYPGTSERVIGHKAESLWITHGAAVVGATDSGSGISAAATSFVLFGAATVTFCGTRESYPPGGQPANAKISAARPLYLMTDSGEIIKATSMTVRSTAIAGPMALTDETGAHVSVGPFYTRWDISGVTRGALGTVAAEADQVFDITTEVYLAEQWLKRHGNGIPKVEVTTELEEFDKELGDFVTIDWEGYLAYGLDGIEAADGNWEIVSKDYDPENASAGVKWLLAWAGVASPTLGHLAIPKIWERGVAANALDAVQNEYIAQKHVVNGLTVSHGSGLDVVVAAGTAAAGSLRATLPADVTITLPANSDCYIFFDLVTGTPHAVAVAHDATAPTGGGWSIRLSKVLTNASNAYSIDGVTDVPTHPINGLNIVPATVGTTQIESGAVQSVHLASGSVLADALGARAVTTPAIGHGVIGPVHQVTMAQPAAGVFQNAQFSIATKK